MPLRKSDTASIMMGAAISFGMSPVLIDHALGRSISESDLAAILMYWGYIAYLLGVPTELIPRTVPEALELVDYIYAVGGGPTWGTEITMDALAPAVDGAGVSKSRSVWLLVRLPSSLWRHFTSTGGANSLTRLSPPRHTGT